MKIKKFGETAVRFLERNPGAMPLPPERKFLQPLIDEAEARVHIAKGRRALKTTEEFGVVLQKGDWNFRVHWWTKWGNEAVLTLFSPFTDIDVDAVCWLASLRDPTLKKITVHQIIGKGETKKAKRTKFREPKKRSDEKPTSPQRQVLAIRVGREIQENIYKRLMDKYGNKHEAEIDSLWITACFNLSDVQIAVTKFENSGVAEHHRKK